MNAKTYRVRNIQEAMRLIREELGPEASVLHTRQIGQSWWNRLSGGPRIEVVAAADVETPSRLPAARPTEKFEAIESVTAPVAISTASATPRRSTASKSERPHREPSKRSEGGSELRRLQERLRAAEIPAAAIRELLEQLRPLVQSARDAKSVQRRLLTLVESEFKTSGPLRALPGQRRVIALIGPTGVGKTTTIAKLAANCQLRERLRVGLITVDTFRIAAADQLRTYADIIGVPLEVVSTPADMSRALSRLENRDLVLLDTSGHGPRDAVRIGELQAMLKQARPDEIHLVASAAASAASLSSIARSFSQLLPTALLVTKLDEAASLGGLWPLLKTYRWPVSYFTGGQNVPEDIEAATSASLARRLLGLTAGGAHG